MPNIIVSIGREEARLHVLTIENVFDLRKRGSGVEHHSCLRSQAFDLYEQAHSVRHTAQSGVRYQKQVIVRAVTWLMVRCKWIDEAFSQCTETISAPALMKSGTRFSGSTIICSMWGHWLIRDRLTLQFGGAWKNLHLPDEHLEASR